MKGKQPFLITLISLLIFIPFNIMDLYNIRFSDLKKQYVENNDELELFDDFSNESNNKDKHIQNMKDKLHIMKYGYWLKIKDNLEDLDREYELKKFKQIEKTHPKFFKYESKSQYPKIILQKFDDLPKFENVNYNSQNFLGELTIIDMNNKNTIRYEHSRLEEYRKRGPYGVIQQIDEEKNIVSDIKIKSLESMIYLFENM